MFKLIRMLILTVMVLSILACQGGEKEKALELSKDFETIQQKYKEKMKTATRDQYMKIMNEQVSEFDALLKKYNDGPSSDEIEIIKSKILLNISRVDEAEKKIDDILAKKESQFTDEAKMVKVQSLFIKNKAAEAYQIFKEIEPRIKNTEDLLNSYLYLSFFAEDNALREEYAKKFLAVENLPEDMIPYKPRVYSALAAVAQDRKDIKQAREYLQQAMDSVSDPQVKGFIQAQMAQLDFIGKPAPAIAGDTWINSSPLSLEKLKGKIVVIDFWATWCNPCRMVMPGLVAAYEKYKDQGLVVIGLTKLYGNYSDDQGRKGSVPAAEEIALVKEFVQRHKLSYPIAISTEGIEFEKYKISGIPTMVYIDRDGNIAELETGVASPQVLDNKIKKLLEGN